jgi:hypothetical protein
MRTSLRLAAPLLLACCGLAIAAAPVAAAGPRNPYSSFNLSGVNYGAQQWDRAQREGRRVWPYYNTPSRSYGGGTVTAGGFVGGAVSQGTVSQGGSYRSSPQAFRRWRR